jgi:ribonucleoside-diphosphate reductase alpha chain
MRFEPAGMTDDDDIRFASSLMDYLFRRLAILYLSKEERDELGIHTIAERTQPTLPGVEEMVTETVQGQDVRPDPPSVESASTLAAQMDLGMVSPTPDTPSAADPVAITSPDAPMCMQCGIQMQRAGSCHACPSCGTTSGCS